MSDPNADQRKARIAELEVRIESIEETRQQLRDGQKLAFGALIGVASLLIVFAWFAGQKRLQAELATISADLDAKNEVRFTELRQRSEQLRAAQDQQIDRKIAVKWQELQIKMASLNMGSSTNFAQLNEDLNRKIALMAELIESKHGEAFGLTYFNQAIITLNRGLYPAATDYFLAATLAYWKGQDEGNVQTCLARLNQYCFPRMRQRDFGLRPSIDERYALLLGEMERANTGGRWQVAIKDLKQAMADARARK
ncbi:MAG: hypothetical protein ISQ14_00485 [Verrucomicrobiae bacterium]|jgi:hypothetical protein|nr:hypothetical protein [Verrucomicrobiae bacterium]